MAMMARIKSFGKARRKVRRIKRALELADVLPGDSERLRLDVGESLQRAVQYVFGASVPGDIIEFGTATGFTASVMAGLMAELQAGGEKRMMRRGGARRLWLFDSFEGLPEMDSDVDKSSVHVRSGLWAAGGCQGLTADGLGRRISRILDEDKIIIRQGWFRDTVPQIPAETRFALVHADCDLYQSTIDCLRPLLERKQIAKGAVIVFDDWNCNAADNDFGERKAWAELAKTHNVEYEDFGHLSWGGRSIIVHAYS